MEGFRNISDKKIDHFKNVVLDLAADGRLEYLGRAKRLLDGGAWWKKAVAFEGRLDEAIKDSALSVEDFVGLVEGWRLGILKGCERMKGSIEKRALRGGKSE